MLPPPFPTPPPPSRILSLTDIAATYGLEFKVDFRSKGWVAQGINDKVVRGAGINRRSALEAALCRSVPNFEAA